MPRERCERDVGQSLTKILWVPGSGEEPIFDEARSELQNVIFLRVASKMQKSADRIATNRKSDDPRAQVIHADLSEGKE